MLFNWITPDATPPTKRNPIVTVVYIYPHAGHDSDAIRFCKSFIECPPEYPCNIVVVSNGGPVTRKTRDLFHRFKGVQFFVHDDSGWDVGAYLALARYRTDLDLMFCCGGPTTFTRPGWMRKIMAAWEEYGPGMYGTNASYEVRPHLNTSGFLIERSELAAYPCEVTTNIHRYEFEWGKGALWRRVRRNGKRTMLVTWDGVWYPEEWRLPRNIYRDGDQSNCLTYFSHSRKYNTASIALKKTMRELVNGLHNYPPCKLAIEVDSASPERKLI